MKIDNGKLDIQKTLGTIKAVHDEFENAKVKQKYVSTPILSDYSKLSVLWAHFCLEIGKEDGGSSIDRQKFIFIAQYLYAPLTLLGERMPKRFRHNLTKVMGIKSGSVISRYSRNSLFFYKNYVKFRADVDRIFRNIMVKPNPLTAQ